QQRKVRCLILRLFDMGDAVTQLISAQYPGNAGHRKRLCPPRGSAWYAYRPSPSFGTPVSSFEFPFSNFQFPASSFEFRISNFEFPISNFALPACFLQLSSSQPCVVSHRLLPSLTRSFHETQ